MPIFFFRADLPWDCMDAMTAAMLVSNAWSEDDMETGSSRFIRAVWAAYKIAHADTVDCLLPIPPLARLACAHGLMYDPCKGNWACLSIPSDPTWRS